MLAVLFNGPVIGFAVVGEFSRFLDCLAPKVVEVVNFGFNTASNSRFCKAEIMNFNLFER